MSMPLPRRATGDTYNSLHGCHLRSTCRGSIVGIIYNPVNDSLRISNLDGDILASMTDAVKEAKASIKHIVILFLESTRKDVFPLKKGSHLHNVIMKSHVSTESAS